MTINALLKGQPTGANASRLSAAGREACADVEKDEAKTMYDIGAKVWFRGDEVTITSEPFTLHGGTFQNAVTADGKTVTVATPAQVKANAVNAQKAFAGQQDQFRRLHE